MSLRTPVGHARGLGAAKEGVKHWRAQRISAIAMVPLCIWFVASVVGLTGADHATVAAWLSNPVVTVLMVLLVAVTLHHAHLGMQVVYEDYIHTHWLMTAADLTTKLAALALGAGTVVAILKIAFGG